ncbi:YgjP family zinc-dependent metalloprotease [Lysobacter fragariae]
MPPSLLRRLLAPTPRVAERDAIELTLADGRTVDVACVRHPRARRLRLSVDERGARLTLPPRASAISGERFLAEHRDWLATQLDRFAIEAVAHLQRDTTSSLPLRGAVLPVHWHAGRYTRIERVRIEPVDSAGNNAAPTGIEPVAIEADCDARDRERGAGEHDGDALAFTVPARAGDAALRRALREFYEGEARADVGRWLPRYLPSLPRAPRRVQFKVMSSQWGSLAPDGTVALDLALVLARPSAYEYVLVHELCHLVRADHSRAFWREVEARFPTWRDERDYFHAEGRRLKATLRSLLAG